MLRQHANDRHGGGCFGGSPRWILDDSLEAAFGAVDDFQIGPVDARKVKSTNLLKEPTPFDAQDFAVPDKPVNLGFEEE